MWMVYRLASVVMVFTMGAVLPSVAQEAPGQPDPIEQLQGQSVLSDEDQATLRAWIDERVRFLVGDDPIEAVRAAKALRDNYKGADSFKRAYATTCTTVIGGAYKQAKRDSAARLIAVLNTLNEGSSYKLLIEVLGDTRVPVRAAAAIGLRRLQAKLAAAGGEAFSETIAALREAGQRETSPVALQLIYRAMDYTEVRPNRPDPKANALALLGLLEARGEQYGTRNVKAEAADRLGLELAGQLAGQFDEPERRRLTVAGAKMLRYAVTRYASDLHKVDDKTSSPVQIALRDRMELFIATTEDLLSKLTSPPEPPSLTELMQVRPEGDKVIDMKNKYRMWADLLQERFQIDVHLDLTEAAPEAEGEAEGSAPKP